MNKRLIAIPTLVAIAVSAGAATTVWDGTAGDGMYTNGLNWGGTAPADDLTSDIAQFTGGTITLDTTRQVNGLDFSTGSTLSGSSGSIEIGSGGIDVNGNSVINTGGLVLNQPNTDITLNGGRLSWGSGLVVSGSGGVTVSGNNTLWVDGNANTYTGGTTITGGAAARLRGAEGLGTGGIVIDNGILAPNGVNTHINEAITIGAGGATVFASTGRLSLMNTISGAGRLTVNAAQGGGDRTVYLDADNSATYTGDVHLNGDGALLAIKSQSLALDSGTANLILEDGGQLKANGQGINLAGRNIQLNGSGGTINVSGHSATITGTLSGSGDLALSGGGSASISTKDNTLSGAVSVDGTQVAMGASGDNGADVLGTGDVSLDNGARLKNNNNHQTINNNISIESGGATLMAGWGKNVTVNGDVSGAGTLTIEGDSGWVAFNGDNNTFNGDISFEENYAAGKLRLASLGDGSYDGVISCDNSAAELEFTGTILLGGDSTFNGITRVTGTGAIGGIGSIDGTLTINAGGKLVFSTTDTLGVAGAVTLDNTFGIDDLIGISSGTANGTYTLIGETTSDFSHIENFGVANAYDLGSGKSAYFENGSLQVTVIPEPATIGMIALFGGGMVFIRRRFMI